MKTYPAKLLLFGEHTVNLGSQALAMPWSAFSGKWVFSPDLGKAEIIKRQMKLPHFADHLARLQAAGELPPSLDVVWFREALGAGLIFDSDIPRGFGAGSSGALTAAVFDTFSTAQPADFQEDGLVFLKQCLAKMEAFFHGTSSGTDPLICYLQRPVLLGGEVGTRVVEKPEMPENTTLFVISTGIEREAGPMIDYFLAKSKETGFDRKSKEVLLPAVSDAMGAYLGGQWPELLRAMHTIGEFQFRNLEKMIPPAFLAVWQEALEGGLFKLKVCGAGGGGFVLGFTEDFEKTARHLEKYEVIAID